MSEVKPKQVLVWRNGRQEVKTLPLSYGGRVGRTTTNNQEAFELYRRIASEIPRGEHV
ncbi:MAG: hypothetical protein JNL15_01160 [Acinetobacter johnsonii]|nr:hypothetical protein [Acinetobacter johnsonii]